MGREEAYEHIRLIKETVVDSGGSMLVPKHILHKTLFCSALMSLLNFGITPEIFLLEGVSIGYRLFFAASVMGFSTFLFYFYVLRILQKENDRLSRPYTKNQRFIGQTYTLITAVGTVMSLTVMTLGGYVTIFFYWLCFVGIALFVLGHFTTKPIKLYGLFLTLSGIAMIASCAAIFGSQSTGLGTLLPETERMIFDFGRYSAVLLSGFGQLGLWGYLRVKNV